MKNVLLFSLFASLFLLANGCVNDPYYDNDYYDPPRGHRPPPPAHRPPDRKPDHRPDYKPDHKPDNRPAPPQTHRPETRPPDRPVLRPSTRPPHDGSSPAPLHRI